MAGILTASETRVRRTVRMERASLWWDTVALLILAVLPVAFFWRFISPNPIDVATLPPGDFTDLHFPYRLFETRELLQGRLPLWNPYVYGGESSLGDIQFGIFYPVNLISSRVLGGNGFTPLDLTVQIAIHFSLAAVFTYLFARRVLRHRGAAFVSALIFTYSGYLTSFPIQQIIILETSIWLPLILLFLDLALERASPSFFALAGAASAMAILVGHPQTFGYVFVGVVAYVAFRLWSAWRGRDEAMKEAQRGGGWIEHITSPTKYRGLCTGTMAGLALFAIATLGLAAIQLLPSYEHLQLTSRTSVGYEFTNGGFRLRELVGLLLPTAFGGKYLYVGILPLLLAGLAFTPSASGAASEIAPDIVDDRRQRVLWLVVGLFALLMSFGGQTFLYSAAFILVPGFKMFRDQERTVFLFSFAVAMLSGYGVKVLAGDLAKRDLADDLRNAIEAQLRWVRWLVLAVAILALLAFAGYAAASGELKVSLGQLSDRANFTLILLALSLAAVYLRLSAKVGPKLFACLAILIIVFDLFSTNWQNNVRLARPDTLFPATKVTTFLNAAKGANESDAFRISSEGLLPGDGNAGDVYALEDITGNSPLATQAFENFEKNVDEIRRWQLFNVKYILTKRKFVDGRFEPLLSEGDVSLYELSPQLRLPRAFLVYRAISAESEDEALRLVKGVDPRNEVILSRPLALPLPAQPPVDSTVTITERSADRITLRTSSSENGVLFLSEVFYPGWKAKVDGQPAEILPADYMFRAIPLEKGSHDVEFVYDPDSLRLGANVSTIAAIIALLAIAGEVVVRLGVFHLFRRAIGIGR